MAYEDANPEARIVVLSDVWLDKPATLKRLETILDGVRWCALVCNLPGEWLRWVYTTGLIFIDPQHNPSKPFNTTDSVFPFNRFNRLCISRPTPRHAGPLRKLPEL